MINSTSGGKHHLVVSPEIKESLREKLNNSKEPLQGYSDAVVWVKSKHDIDVNYHTLRSFMIVNFGTKLKQLRKSHYKKDEQAFGAFKKKLPELLKTIIKQNKDKFKLFNLYFQDESRF